MSDTTKKIALWSVSGLIFIVLDVALVEHFKLRDHFWINVLVMFGLAQLCTALVTKTLRRR
ncbi:hypothetical protein Amal_00454 [Acetobacter malorum]|uniref:Uncharacterized protein n=1 Tax=Acetobacter malorum TaxID=178901 RepID=A0A177G4W0_9PROT|nr:MULTISPECIES: hypothetical protein [Acetobacter]OAG75378.1 hypothetical protein Amal_03453 [Acetobacter malorum]OAG78441.1 hypothetical protein Amal_00454 [Acetobacter malorum]